MKTLKWLAGNTAFGLFPLFFMCSVFLISNEKFGGEQIEGLVYEGTILFVSIAVVGSVLVDFYLSGIRVNGFSRFATYFTPCFILFIVTVNYSLIQSGYIDKHRFSPDSYTTILVVALSVIYITFVKTNLYMKEGYKHEHGV